MITFHTIKLPILITLAASANARAALVFFLPGTSESEGWDGLTSANYGAARGFPTYPTATSAWPSSIPANVAGSARSAVLEKVSGGGYFASSSLYDTGTAGTFRIRDSSPIANLATVIFQADTGTSIGVPPVLNYNGGSQALVPDFSLITDGGYPTFNFSTGESLLSANHAWQWDLGGIGESITSYEILWGSTPNNHLSQYEFNLTTSDSFVQTVPEPSALLLAALLPLAALRRRRPAVS